MVCGTAVALPAPASGPRFLAALFCDVVNSTGLALQYDPDVWAAVLDAHFRDLSALIRRAGGRLEKFIGDAVVAVFGIADSGEQAALDAVQAAVEVARAVRDRPAPRTRQPRLTVRIAVTSGYVAIAERDSTFVVGPVLNRAARLQPAAVDNGVVVDLTTWLQVRHQVATTPLAAVSAKGFDTPLPAWSVDVDHAPRHALPVAPMVGREKLAGRLRDGVERALLGQVPHVLAVTGDAGVGKSRLVSEVLAGIPARRIILRCPRQATRAGLLPLYLYLSGVDTAAAQSQAEARIGIDLSMAPAAGETAPMQERRELLLAAVEAMRRFRGTDPLVIVIDDAQWMPDAISGLLEMLTGQSDFPGTAVVLAGRQVQADSSTELVVPPLSGTQAQRLARLCAAADFQDPPRAFDAAAIGRASGGNPLFVEQIVNGLRYGASAELVAPSAHAAIGARIERLSKASADLLALLSIYGQPLRVEDVAAMARHVAIAPAITELIAGGILDDGRALPGELAVASTLVSEVTYRRLGRGDRYRLHSLVADHLAGVAVRRPAAVELLADHRELAYQAADADDRDLTIRTSAAAAIEALMASARFSLSRGDHTAALSAMTRAQAITPVSTDRAAMLAAIETYAYGRAGQVAKVLERVGQLGLVASPNAQVLLSLNQLFANPHLPGQSDPAASWSVVEIARGVTDPEALACAHLYVGFAAMQRGDYVTAFEWLSSGHAHAAAVPHCLGSAELSANLGLAAILGDGPARAAVRTCARLYREAAGSRLGTATAGSALALALHMAGNRYRPPRLLADSARIFTDLKLDGAATAVASFEALLAARSGDWSRAIELWQDQAARWTRLGMTSSAVHAALQAAAASAGSGRAVAVSQADVDLLADSPDWSSRVVAAQASAAAALSADDRAAAAGQLERSVQTLRGVRGNGALLLPLTVTLRLALRARAESLAGAVGAELSSAIRALSDRGILGVPDKPQVGLNRARTREADLGPPAERQSG